MQMCVEANQGTPTRTVRRISPQIFWTLLALEGVVLTLVLAWVLAALAPHTPVANTQDLPLLKAAISDRLTGAVDDPIIEVVPGVSVRESNLRGLALNGVTYYYYVEGKENFDPFSRGLVPQERVEKIFRDDSGPNPVVIYIIHS